MIQNQTYFPQSAMPEYYHQMESSPNEANLEKHAANEYPAPHPYHCCVDFSQMYHPCMHDHHYMHHYHPMMDYCHPMMHEMWDEHMFYDHHHHDGMEHMHFDHDHYDGMEHMHFDHDHYDGLEHMPLDYHHACCHPMMHPHHFCFPVTCYPAGEHHN